VGAGHQGRRARGEIADGACLAIEDSRNGLLAAATAGVPVLITRSLYLRDDDFMGASA
jgi:beta-phosphoglucomutase-like phosphatase (HAD superfamily)